MDNPDRVTYFAATDSRGKRVPFGIKEKDRSKHMYVIGKTGMGKSTLLENMAIQDIRNGEGLAFIDPHGGTADKLLEYIPANRIKDVVYFAPFDLDQPIAFNVMEDVGYDKRHLVVSGLMATFKKIWEDSWSARMEYILTNTLLALLEYPDATLLGVNRMYTDKAYRKKVIDNVKDPIVKDFWTKEFANYGDRYTQEATPAIQNKIGQFTGNPLIRNIIAQPKSSFDIREMMDQRKILIINLSKGQVGETNMRLLGSMLTTRLFLGAMSRADLSAGDIARLPNFFLYVDEFQNFANETFAEILSEARKYKLNLTIAHQYVEQMEEEVAAAVFGNVGTTIAFRVGPFDAEKLELVFAPEFTTEDIVNLGPRQIYLSLMIDGVGSRPFSASTIPPIEPPPHNLRSEVIAASRTQFGSPRSAIEAAINAELALTSQEALPDPNATPRLPRPGQGSTDRPKGDTRTTPRRDDVRPQPPVRDTSAPVRESGPREVRKPDVRKDTPREPSKSQDQPRERSDIRPAQASQQRSAPPSSGKSAEELRDILRSMTKKEPVAPTSAPLKDALSSVMKQEPKAAPEPASAPQAPERSAATGPYEVPEETLRAIFKEPL